jgi:hypothetical protein
MKKLSPAVLGTLLSLFVSETSAGIQGPKLPDTQLSSRQDSKWHSWKSFNGKIMMACKTDDTIHSRRKLDTDSTHPSVTITAILVDKDANGWKPTFDGMSPEEIYEMQNSDDFQPLIQKIVTDCRAMLKAAKDSASTGPKIWRNGLIENGDNPAFPIRLPAPTIPDTKSKEAAFPAAGL